MKTLLPVLRSVHILLLLGVVACTKEATEESPPPITDYRTYDRVPVAVKPEDGGGFAILCKNTPFERRTGYLQELSATGLPAARMDLDELPRSVENITFPGDELLYTDFVRRPDGAYIVVGTGRQTDLEDRLHLIVQQVRPDGGLAGEPFRRFLASNAVVSTNIDPDLTQDLDGLPRQRALCDLTNDGLVVAARWETATEAGVRLFRFPSTTDVAPTIVTDIPLDRPTDRLLQLTCDPTNGRTIIVTDVFTDGARRVKVRGFIPWTGGWVAESGSVIDVPRLEPQQLSWAGGSFTLVGNAPLEAVQPNGQDLIRPFITRFSDAAGAAQNYRRIDGIAADDRPVAAYCALAGNVPTRLFAQVHGSSALQPYAAGDITSDLVVVDLDDAGSILAQQTIIPGQGLRAMGAFIQNGKPVIIGSQHPFLNAGYVHTFYLVLE